MSIQAPHPEAAPFERIVVPLEGAADELVAQESAVEYARALGSRVRAVHVAQGVSDPPEDVFAYMATLCAAHDVPFERVVLHNEDVLGELLAELGPTDLVVIGTRRLGTTQALRGITQGLIRGAPCPVQVLRLS